MDTFECTWGRDGDQCYCSDAGRNTDQQTHPDIKRIGRAQNALPCGLAHSIARLYYIAQNHVKKACELSEGDTLLAVKTGGGEQQQQTVRIVEKQPVIVTSPMELLTALSENIWRLSF